MAGGPIVRALEAAAAAQASRRAAADRQVAEVQAARKAAAVRFAEHAAATAAETEHRVMTTLAAEEGIDLSGDSDIEEAADNQASTPLLSMLQFVGAEN